MCICMLRAQDYATVELISAGMGHKVLSGRASGLAPVMSSHAPIAQCREVCQISARVKFLRHWLKCGLCMCMEAKGPGVHGCMARLRMMRPPS